MSKNKNKLNVIIVIQGEILVASKKSFAEADVISEIIRLCDEKVYLPSDDTFILSNFLKRFLGSIKVRNSLEIGCGSGFIGCVICRDVDYLVLTDIDLGSAECSHRITEFCGCKNIIDVVVCRSGECFRENSFDLVYSNPPYLPCSDDPKWCGGSDGVSVALAILRNLQGIMKKHGVALILLSTLGDLRKFLAEAHENGYKIKVVDKLRKFFETLMVIMIMRRDEQHKHHSGWSW